MDRADRGQTLPLVALVLLACAGLLVAIAELGRIARDRAVAQTAADTAALAAVVEGPGAAEELAVANGAELQEVRIEHGEAVVVVRRGRASATAWARLDEEDAGGPHPPWPPAATPPSWVSDSEEESRSGPAAW